jgi:hypothetical protein
MQCPKCAYERKASDDAPAWQCPSCKVAYLKVQAKPVPALESESRSEQKPQFELAPKFELEPLAPKAEREPTVELALKPELAARQQPSRKSVLGSIADTDEADQDEDSSDEEQEERHWLAAAGQKIVIYSIIINFVLNSAQKAELFSATVMGGLFFCTAAYSLLGVIKICSGLDKTQNQKILYMIFSFFPLINIVMLVYLSVKTSRMLRAAGWKIGLLGAKP